MGHRFRQLVFNFSELVLMQFIAILAIINSMNMLKQETAEENKNKNFGRSSTLRLKLKCYISSL